MNEFPKVIQFLRGKARILTQVNLTEAQTHLITLRHQISPFLLETMLPSHIRSSQVFHKSVSSFWPPPKLPCEQVRVTILDLL